MNALFLMVFNMSISASWLILAVLLLRLALKRAPKWVSLLLWGIAALRLAVPLSIESAFSLLPSAQTVPANIEMTRTPLIDSGIEAVNAMVNPVISGAWRRPSGRPAGGKREPAANRHYHLRVYLACGSGRDANLHRRELSAPAA